MGQHARSGDALRRKLLEGASERDRRRLVVLSGLPPSSGVNDRLLQCGRVVDRSGRKRRCNRPLCPSCGERAQNKKTKKKTLALCEAAVARGCTIAHLTIALAPTHDLERLRPLFKSAKRRLAECRMRLRERNPHGLSIAAEGQMEIALVPDDQLHLVGEGRQRTLTELGFPEAEFGGPVWCPHLHLLLIVPPGTTLDETGDDLRHIFKAWRQVHLKPIPPGIGFARGIYRVARYGAKFIGRTEVEKPHQRNWSPEEISLLLDWTTRNSPRGRRGVTIALGMNKLSLDDVNMRQSDAGEGVAEPD